MTKAEARTDQIYQITMSMAKKLLTEGKISEEDYRQFDTKMQKKKDGSATVRFKGGAEITVK